MDEDHVNVWQWLLGTLKIVRDEAFSAHFYCIGHHFWPEAVWMDENLLVENEVPQIRLKQLIAPLRRGNWYILLYTALFVSSTTR